jgi:alanine racemase
MTSSAYSLSSRYGGDSIARDAWLEIDLNILESNLQLIKVDIKKQAEIAGFAMPEIMGIVKADAYGHGAVAISEILAACAVSWLGVASADEGSQLREANCKLPILILGPTPLWAVKKAIEQKLDLTISSLPQLQGIIETLKDDNSTVSIHLKVDTGMHRLGMNEADVLKALEYLKANKKFKLVSVFSHLAKASDFAFTEKQKKNFERFIEIFKSQNCQPEFFHLASADAALRFASTYYDLVRIGISIYGLEAQTVSANLLPVMSVRGRINQINVIKKGESVGYGLTWKSDRQSRLANIPIGYADGVDRGLSNKMKGLLHNKTINQVGTISMDQMLFDITDIPLAKEGDVITIIGSDDYGVSLEDKSGSEQPTLYLADWARQLDTITYELACKLKVRLPRIYTRNRSIEHLQKSSLVTDEKGK